MENRFQLPKNVQIIIDELNRAGYEAYAVGGCVRDMLLFKEPQDWDITTSATPEKMKEIFPKTIDTGIQHGTITVRMGGESYEVTTYRIDGEYEDGRHPKQVQFTSSLREDLRRRDFTINAMAYSDTQGLIDLFEGKKDLKEHRIKAVGNPMERFSEDALRMLRAARFSAQLGFCIEEETKKAMKALAKNLKQVSQERIHTEFIKLLVSPHPEEIMVCYETGLLEQFFPELSDAVGKRDAKELSRLISSLQQCKPDKDLRLVLLFHFSGESGSEAAVMAEKVLRRLKLDGNTINRTTHLLRYLTEYPEGDMVAMRHYFSQVTLKYAEDLVYLKKLLQGEEAIAELEKALYRIIENRECIDIKELAITGSDLLALGVQQGREVGEWLKTALDYVMERPECNEKEILTDYIKGLF